MPGKKKITLAYPDERLQLKDSLVYRVLPLTVPGRHAVRLSPSSTLLEYGVTMVAELLKSPTSTEK